MSSSDFDLFQHIESLLKHPSKVWGANCDGGDVIVELVDLPQMRLGDSLVFPDMGAYTSMHNGLQWVATTSLPLLHTRGSNWMSNISSWYQEPSSDSQNKLARHRYKAIGTGTVWFCYRVRTVKCWISRQRTSSNSKKTSPWRIFLFNIFEICNVSRQNIV